jgi:hypothetical protein
MTDNVPTLPKEIRDLPGMTSSQERFCLYRHALTLEPIGQVIDLGCWLGSLTASLTAGILGNPQWTSWSGRIYAYDTFKWHSWMTPSAIQFGLPVCKDGESFLALFNRTVAPWNSRIEARVGDIAEQSWTGEPIAFLSIDAMKDLPTTRAIVNMFFPYLIPGRSLVFQQDFSHYYTSWVHLVQWRLRRHFSLIEDVPGSGGILFRYEEAIPHDQYDALLNFTNVTDEDWQAAFEHSRQLALPEKREKLAAAEIMRLVHENRGADAEKLARYNEEQGIAGPESKVMKSTQMWKDVVGPYER